MQTNASSPQRTQMIMIKFISLSPKTNDDLDEICKNIMQRPFPSPYMITDILTKTFSDTPQHVIYRMVKDAKQIIATQECIASLQIQQEKAESRN